jgi:hypothetical protein
MLEMRSWEGYGAESKLCLSYNTKSDRSEARSDVNVHLRLPPVSRRWPSLIALMSIDG